MNLNCKKSITILSILSVIFAFVGSITELFHGDVYYFIIADYPLKIVCILFVMYAVKLHKNFKARVLIPIIFGLSALIFPIYGFYYIMFVLALIVEILFLLATYVLLKGIHKKAIIILAPIAGILFVIFNFIRRLTYLLKYKAGIIDWVYPLSHYIGFILLFVALLLLVSKNKIPAILNAPIKKKIDKNPNPEQELKELKVKYEAGWISEEEYQSQRLEIINKL